MDIENGELLVTPTTNLATNTGLLLNICEQIFADNFQYQNSSVSFDDKLRK